MSSSSSTLSSFASSASSASSSCSTSSRDSRCSSSQGRSVLNPTHPLLAVRKDGAWYGRSRMNLDLNTYVTDSEERTMMTRKNKVIQTAPPGHVCIPIMNQTPSEETLDEEASMFPVMTLSDRFASMEEGRASRACADDSIKDLRSTSLRCTRWIRNHVCTLFQ
jgi:hypothetical protein